MNKFTIESLLKDYQRQADEGDGSAAAMAVLLRRADLVVGLDDDMLATYAGNSGIRWTDLAEDPEWEIREEILIRTAVSLWRSEGWEVSIGRAVTLLDSEQYPLWQAMIEARRAGKIPEGFR